MQLVSAITICTLAVPLIAGRGSQISREDSEWLAQVRQRAYDALMPLDGPGMRAAYRTDPELKVDEVEQYFGIAITGPSPQPMEATVVVPVTAIQRQLVDLHNKDPRGSFESKLVRVSVRRFVVKSTDCPAIRSRMSALSNLDISLRDDGVIRLDPIVHRILVNTSSGTIRASLGEAGHALARWASVTHAALLACGRAGAAYSEK